MEDKIATKSNIIKTFKYYASNGVDDDEINTYLKDNNLKIIDVKVTSVPDPENGTYSYLYYTLICEEIL